MMNRRTLISATAGTAAGSVLAGSANATVRGFQPLTAASSDRMKMLISTAMDTAKSAGADYADARLTFSQEMSAFGNAIDGGYVRPFNRFEYMAFGVRARCNGYWGFASSTVWTKEEAARLGRMAVDSAQANFSGRSREVGMAPSPGAISGDWIMPVQDDPFEMDPDEISDYLYGLADYISNLPLEYIRPIGSITTVNVEAKFYRQQKAFGNIDGQLVTQRLYRTGGKVSWGIDRSDEGGTTASGAIRQFNMFGGGAGFEIIRSPYIREWCRELHEELAEEALLPWIPVEVGRYDCLIQPDAVAPLVKKSIGVATEIDRVMGFEANTTGTSYILDPNAELGSLKIGAAGLNVTATRSAPGSLAHVKWDDEGVAPRDVELVKNGVVTNLQTGREGTAWMADYLQKNNQPVLSSGSMYGIDAHEPPTIHPSDLILHPDSKVDLSVAQLREQMGDGLEFKSGFVLMDFQQSTGMLANDMAFQIKKGKRVAKIISPAVLFRTPELWGNIKALGGPGSSMRVGTGDYKSNPAKYSYSSVDAPAVLFKELSVINPAQKA